MPAPKTPIGRLEKLFYDGCFPNPLVMAEGAVDSAMNIYTGFLSPDFKEIIHLGAGATYYHAAEETMEEVTEDAPKAVANARDFLFGLGRGLEVASFFGFLGALVAEQLFAWTSQMYRFAPCEHVYPPGYGYSPAVYGAWPDRGNWGTADFVMLPPSIYGPVDPGLGGPHPGYRLTAWGVWLAGRDFNGHPVPVSVEVRNSFTGAIEWSGSSDPDKPGENGWLMHWIDVPPGGGLDGLSVAITSPGVYPLHECFPARGSGGFIASTPR